jgi:hypothetical protein
MSFVGKGRPGSSVAAVVGVDPVEELVRAIEELRAERDEDRAIIEELQIALAGPTRRMPLRRCTRTGSAGSTSG